MNYENSVYNYCGQEINPYALLTTKSQVGMNYEFWMIVAAGVMTEHTQNTPSLT